MNPAITASRARPCQEQLALERHRQGRVANVIGRAARSQNAEGTERVAFQEGLDVLSHVHTPHYTAERVSNPAGRPAGTPAAAEG